MPDRARYFKAGREGAHGVRTLLVDDLAYNLRTLRAIFHGAGYEVETAADGQAALGAARTRRPDSMVNAMLEP